ncbi:beta-ketoacyl-[acyl-carrier-protein] synthase family protein [Oleidesulfovibrio sp.]|uniref:beta-ketoacyl-[acyl-carrier-protein] synthase family protein n=1 Tax=Oleidesulfovibrio sp. TaxID=2909707 RepID=UPI003A879E91
MTAKLHRVVITGYGAITPLGNTPDAICDALKNGQTAFECSAHLAGVAQCPADFCADTALKGWRHRRYLNRGAAMAVAATKQAVRSAGLQNSIPYNCGVFAGSGPNLDIGSDFADIQGGNLDQAGLSALWMLRYLPNTAASAISQMQGAHGENMTLGTACAASLQAIGEAFRRIRYGVMPMALAGGGDSRLSHGGLLAYAKAGALAPCSKTKNDGSLPPDQACRPFDTSRQGFVAGEGGAMFVLESLEHALARGVRPLAEVCGYGCSMDGHAMTAPHPEGAYAELAVRSALNEAGIMPHELAAVCAHGTGTPRNDEAEAAMLDRLFAGNTSSPILALKSWTGHCASACGAVELAVLLACTGQGFLPAIRNLRLPLIDELSFLTGQQSFSCAQWPLDASKKHESATEHNLGLNAVESPSFLSCSSGNGQHNAHNRAQEITTQGTRSNSHVLLESFGFGGQNAALVVRPFAGSSS